MTKIRNQERYLIIFALLLACVMILASAGLEISKRNEAETGIELFTDVSDDISTETNETVSTAAPAEDVLSSSVNRGDEQNDEPMNEFSTGSVPDQTNTNSDKVTLTVSGSLEYVSPEEMSRMSDVIIIGTVKEVLPSEWNTRDGQIPTDDIYELEWYDIYTDVVITVDEYLKNPLSETEVIVRTLGGEKDVITINVEDEPSFNPGEKVFLYLKNDTWPNTMSNGPEHFVVTGVSQGKFTLTNDGEAISFGETLTLDELMETI